MRIQSSVLVVLVLSFNSFADPGYKQQSASDDNPAQAAAVVSTDTSNKTAAVTTVTTRAEPSKKVGNNKQSVTFESLEQLNQLIEVGVPALALSLLEDEQKKREQFTADWYSFEYKRIVILSSLERWQQVIDRVRWLIETTIPGRNITSKIRLWFETQQVIARLQLKQSELALDQLQKLLWHSSSKNRDPSLPVVWRRLVIRAYLQLQLDDDARKALVKYNRDYKTDANDIDWVLLQAQVLLRTNRPQLAINVLNQVESKDEVDVNALLLIARLQSDPKNAKKIKESMRKQLDGQVLSASDRWAKSYVAYTAAKILKQEHAQIVNLESMLSLNLRYPVFDESYQVSADDLWALYSKQGLKIANDHGLLIGNDEQWQKLSNKLIKSAPQKALQLNATLVLHTEDFSTKKLQHKTIVEILEKRKNGLELINKLYLHSDKVKDVSVLPDEVRYRLVDYSLAEGDYYEAAILMKTLKEPPEGKTLFDWRMRKARVLVLQGEYKQSEDLIRKTFIEKPKITRAELDRYIQVLFDFQTVQQHQRAINLFDLLYIDGLDESLKREIYFWKAESYYSLKNYDYAALFYLKSARAVSGGENDLWAQSARFKAGDALIFATIYDDAEKVYIELLAITDSEARKALISQNLQKIRLLKNTLKITEKKKGGHI
jgi:tetratricopeptide (TPR) repeat protein